MESTELSLSPACRILVVSNDITHTKELVSRIQSLANTPLTPRSDNESYVEWIIKNKYYTAPVHLRLHQASKPPAKPLWPPETEDERVPALIFVFRKGEAYQDTFLSMREGYLAHDPEVAIAVGLPSSSDVSAPGSIEKAEEFFLDHNFEYVDADDEMGAVSSKEETYPDAVGLSRILEALNMIMWPSMVRTPHGGLRRTAPASDIDDEVDYSTFDTSFATVSDTEPPHNPSLFGAESGSSALSLAELNAWLDSDDSWVRPSGNNHPTPSYDGIQTSAHASVSGFGDDFSDFLSAPPIDEQDTGLPSTADVRATAGRIFDPPGFERDAPEGFDLSSVLGSLEAMRAEISEISDIDERRKAAARVALGLAMGLGLDSGNEDELDEELLRELHHM
ncbi:hypothetical protein RhiLY_05465 [Ceratobasidium sp. AG-Ba]|nr:hypothetical protein RhiLY_05465 [Ceratobasidium sp. AG-Ba]